MRTFLLGEAWFWFLVGGSIAWALYMSGCAYGGGYWAFPQDANGYHFDPCLHMDKVRPENRRQYEIECP